ncbi:hypothetical protein [Streptomyces mirabilis]|uniref:hypothetical protein n=1 Tax=Streptomyces mirabilis TaxID=68239 RepID=UPI0036D1EBD8
MAIDITEAVTVKPTPAYLDELFATGQVPAHNAGGDAAVPDSDFTDETVYTASA